MKKSLITKITCLFLFAGLYTADIQAQCIHFSQFYNQPLYLNPALTGSEIGKYRAAVTYRNQEANVIAPYSTIAINPNISFNPNALRMKKGVNELAMAGATLGYHFGGVGEQGNAVL